MNKLKNYLECLYVKLFFRLYEKKRCFINKNKISLCDTSFKLELLPTECDKKEYLLGELLDEDLSIELESRKIKEPIKCSSKDKPIVI